MAGYWNEFATSSEGGVCEDTVASRLREAALECFEPLASGQSHASPVEDPFSHVAKANAEFQSCGLLSPSVRKEYEAAIKAADCQDLAGLTRQIEDLNKKMVQAYPEELQQRAATLEKERDAMLTNLPDKTQEELKNLVERLGSQTSEEGKNQVRDEIRVLLPDVAKKQDEIDALQAKPRAILGQIQTLQNQLNSPALTRFAYAEALRMSGETETAAKLMEQVAMLDPKAREDSRWQSSAREVGLRVDECPAF